MSIPITGVGLIDLAMQTEIRGAPFCRQAKATAQAEPGPTRDLFTYLAEQVDQISAEERSHVRKLATMRAAR